MPDGNRADMNGVDHSLLPQHHVALSSQFETGGQRAGPGRTPPQGGLRRALRDGGRVRQKALDRPAIGGLRETPEDPASWASVMKPTCSACAQWLSGLVEATASGAKRP